MIHRLKTKKCFFHDMKIGIKTFDVRRDDRDFKIGDRLDLFVGEEEIDANQPREHLHRWVSYILEGGQLGIEAGFVVLGLLDTEDF